MRRLTCYRAVSRLGGCATLLVAALLVAALLLSTNSATAADKRPLDLPLVNGKVLRGTIDGATHDEVAVRTGPESVRHVPWAQLAPLGYFRAHAALAPAADGEARLKLGELAVELGLYAEARIELEKALALGAIKAKAFERIVTKAEHDAVVAGVARAQRAAESGDLETALETARQLKLDFAGAPNAAAIHLLVAELVKQVRELDEQATAAQQELARIKLAARRNKEILTRTTQALDLYKQGEALAAECAAKRKQGSVTRAKRLAEKADQRFVEARRHLGRLRRVLPVGHPARQDVLARLGRLDRIQFDLLYGMAWFLYHRAGVYTHAERYAARASYIDPVHPDLIELRDLLIASRIRYRLSDVTGARGTVSGGGSFR